MSGRKLIEITDFETLKNRMEAPGFHLFYFSRPECGVCAAIKPKVIEMLGNYPGIESYYVDLDRVPEAVGQLSLFTIPGILLFLGGHELVREARYISMDTLEASIARPYNLANS